jgi:uncharacterized membrane protein (DUF485 family)
MSANLAARAATATPSAEADDQNRVLRNPKFRELVASRNSFARTLTALMLVIYFGFILLVAFDKPLLATRIGDSTVSVGIVAGLAVLISAFVLVAIYVVRANGRFDELTRELRQEIGR